MDGGVSEHTEDGDEDEQDSGDGLDSHDGAEGVCASRLEENSMSSWYCQERKRLR